jgi:hypothetical protein
VRYFAIWRILFVQGSNNKSLLYLSAQVDLILPPAQPVFPGPKRTDNIHPTSRIVLTAKRSAQESRMSEESSRTAKTETMMVRMHRRSTLHPGLESSSF